LDGVYTAKKENIVTRRNKQPVTARRRLIIAAILGAIVAVSLSLLGHAAYAPLAGWDTIAVFYAGATLAAVLPFNATDTRRHARSENPGRTVGDGILLVTSLASIVAVGVLVLLAGKAEGLEKAVDIGLGLFSIVVSWLVVHCIFLLNYARQYYGDPEGGISFNEQAAPRYADFAYLAFTIGMTFQVSDTNIQTKALRTTILKHALLSYLFGTVIIATTINTLASLSQ
jgi:uncharacterized membrane protein